MRLESLKVEEGGFQSQIKGKWGGFAFDIEDGSKRLLSSFS